MIISSIVFKNITTFITLKSYEKIKIKDKSTLSILKVVENVYL